MTARTVLIADPVGGDASVIEATLRAHGISAIKPRPGQDWRSLAAHADGLIVNLVPVDASAFDKLTCCRVITRLGVGINTIDIATARDRNIVVTNVPKYCREEVSDHALALILALVRKLPTAHADVEKGHWNQLGYRPIHRLCSLTLGLVGYGQLAQALARKAHALGMRIVAHDPYAAPDDSDPTQLMPLQSILGEADIISLHAPLAADTRGMIGRSALDQMKRGAILINTSRGELIDESALVYALDNEHLSAAGLDVFASEPLAVDSLLRGRSNVLLTPHVAFYSEESLEELQRTAAEDVVRVLSGHTPHHRVT